jgi:hypothetical protein
MYYIIKKLIGRCCTCVTCVIHTRYALAVLCPIASVTLLIALCSPPRLSGSCWSGPQTLYGVALGAAATTCWSLSMSCWIC